MHSELRLMLQFAQSPSNVNLSLEANTYNSLHNLAKIRQKCLPRNIPEAYHRWQDLRRLCKTGRGDANPCS